MQDLDLWLVLISLVVTAVALGRWLNKAGDDWLLSQLDPSFSPPRESGSTDPRGANEFR